MINNLLQLKSGLKKYGGNIKTIQYLYDSNSKLQEWYKSYESDSLEKEEENYTYFASTILTGVLGYIDQTDFNHEKKLGKGKSADFTILKDGEPYIVIELKGSKTNLDKKYNKKPSAVDQAFDYGSEKKSIEWVIVSNYYEFRLYHKNTKENMVSFNLDELIYHNGNKHILQLFLLVFSKESVLDHDNLNKLYDEDQLIIERENINKNFYNLYHHTRILLIDQLQDKGYDKENSITYSETILNRVIFICFCEDMGLLPSKSINNEILEPVEKGRLGDNRIWRGLNDLWKDVDHGNPHIGIPSYNGGLFKENLNNLNLSDEIKSTEHIKVSHGFKEKEENIDNLIKDFPYLNPIYRNLLIISSFNYSSELNVNILGHIFEQSITDIEKLKENEELKQRKKQGIYYTPEVITEYICLNTIIPYLSSVGNNSVTGLVEEYKDDLSVLEDKLRRVKIVDPACGSGAFLNKATDTLLDIYSLIHDCKYKNNGDDLKPFFDDIKQQRTILLNNIYGVDLNKASVEITKLSLFLKVAQSEDKLPDLDNNIKIGDSLISDPEYTIHPFNWNEEFKEIMDDGGFDIVIGNPPYGILIDKNLEEYYSINFPLTNYKKNFYILFIERMLQLFKTGIIHFIIPKSLLFNISNSNIRKELLLKTQIDEIFTITDKVFKDAEVGSSLLLKFIIKKPSQKHDLNLCNAKNLEDFKNENNIQKETISQKYFLSVPEYEISFLSLNSQNLLQKLLKFSKLGDFFILKNGINLGNVKHVLISDKKENENYKPIIWGKNIGRFIITWSVQYVNYDEKIRENISIDDIKSKKGMKNQDKIDFSLRTPDLFENEKIVIRKTGDSLISCYDNNNLYFDSLVHGIYKKDKNFDLIFLMTILNSSSATYFYRLLHDVKGKVFPKINLKSLLNFPLPETPSNEQEPFVEMGKIILNLNKKKENEIQSFQKYLKSDFKVNKINKMLSGYYDLSFEQLYEEVKKQYKDITRKEKDKLEKEYTESTTILKPLQSEIDKIDKEIDKLVYELYNLTEDEIAIIEK